MRILRLRFRNLNSLRGEWSVDFTAPLYVSNGIFAVTGPTGAGKTTIFDAVCLALYGRTPRLGKITKSGNEIMSRQTGECFSEATFETGEGRFRCHWSQRRARKKPDGRLQEHKHEISDDETGDLLESKVRDVLKIVEEKTGMDFDRFTRSMLLAQGGFAAFLQADSSERGPILEQITGTEIYSRISVETHEKRRAEKQKLELLEAELKGVVLLTQEERKGWNEKLDVKEKSEKELAEKNSRLRKASNWLGNIAKLGKELESIEAELQLFRQKREEFEPGRKALERAEKALLLEGRMSSLSSLRERLKKDALTLNSDQERLPEHEKATVALKTAMKKAETALTAVGKRVAEEREVIKKVRAFDLQINEAVKMKSIFDKDIEKTRTELAKFKKCEVEIDKRLDETKAEMAENEKLLEFSRTDSSLASELTGIEEKLESLERDFGKVDKLGQALSRAGKKKDAQALSRSKLEKSAVKLEQNLKESRKLSERISASISERLEGRKIKDLRDDLDALKERSRFLKEASELFARISAAETKLPTLKKANKDFIKDKESATKELKLISEKHKALETNIECLEDQAKLIHRVITLEAERGNLEDGKPCPLCGSENHPYAEGNVPTIGKTERRIKEAKKERKSLSSRKSDLKVKLAGLEKDVEQNERKIREELSRLEEHQALRFKLLRNLNVDDDQEKVSMEQVAAKERISAVAALVADLEKDEEKLKKAERELGKLRDDFVKRDKELREARHKENAAENELERISREKEEAEARLARNQKRVLELLQPYGIPELARRQIKNVGKDLTRRLNDWQTKLKRKSALEKRLSLFESDLDKHRLLIERSDGDLKIKSDQRGKILEELDSLRKKRKELYGIKNADNEEKLFDASLAAAEKKLAETRQDREKAERDLNALASSISSLTKSIGKLKTEADMAERSLANALNIQGFKDEADYLAARLSQEKREALKRHAETLSQKQTELKTRRQDLSAKLDAERVRKLTDRPLRKLVEELDETELKLKNLRQEIGAVKHKLSEDAEARDKRQEHVRAAEAQKKELSRWDALHKLIGSVDGKKYRNFAQGLTFEIVIAQANRRLRKMTDRYLLIRDAVQPLELNVVDNYQAGEIRSARNLSGGESFVVSLSLALGLSKMAGRKIAVDSLFLDEGFGSLDENSLETALEALSSLRLDGKLIGIISHVPLLKERIEVQIQVSPLTGGRSVLNGPGCRRI